jgi:hypothetical protein
MTRAVNASAHRASGPDTRIFNEAIAESVRALSAWP